MPAKVSISIRPATPGELHRLGRGQPEELSMGLVMRLAFVFSVLGAYLGENSGGLVGGIFGFVFPLVLAGGFTISSKRSRGASRERIALDLKEGEVEQLTVEGAEPRLIHAKLKSVEPALAFELQGGRTLLLVGPWLSDPRTFDGPEALMPRGDGRPYANQLVPPYAFPVDSFVLHRFAKSGNVARLDLHGEYVTPSPFGGALSLMSLSGFQSRLLDVPLSKLAEALERRL
jgi:hypothetical protein